jgi:hypothetical protein
VTAVDAFLCAAEADPSCLHCRLSAAIRVHLNEKGLAFNASEVAAALAEIVGDLAATVGPADKRERVLAKLAELSTVKCAALVAAREGRAAPIAPPLLN